LAQPRSPASDWGYLRRTESRLSEASCFAVPFGKAD
jgi:hypothetical protein